MHGNLLAQEALIRETSRGRRDHLVWNISIGDDTVEAIDERRTW
jgi:hypothetical protein